MLPVRIKTIMRNANSEADNMRTNLRLKLLVTGTAIKSNK